MKTNSNPYLTVLTIVFGILSLSVFLENNTLVYLSIILSGLGVFSLRFSKIIEIIWFKFSFILSQIIPNILLTIIFFFILTPLALLSKLFKVRSEFKSVNKEKSLFIKTNKTFNKESFERSW
tara:strand:- start:690 stop:1055 length:366 start_codon:yes stop_codon:yes gene_type:complete